MAFPDKVYLKQHRQLTSALDANFPRSVFAGATLDLLFQADGLGELPTHLRDPVVAFATDFLDCGCDSNPFCGHPEEQFMEYILELRTEGHDPGAIVDIMTDEYLVYAFAGDVRTFLDDAVRRLEAIEDLAAVEDEPAMVEQASRLRTQLESP